MTDQRKPSARQRKVDSISKRIATFAITEVYTDEPEAQRELAEAIGHLNRAKELLREEAQ